MHHVHMFYNGAANTQAFAWQPWQGGWDGVRQFYGGLGEINFGPLALVWGHMAIP
jgi:hypothetical protein